MVLDVPTVSDPADIEWGDDDVVLLATKTHQTPAALEQLAAVAPREVPILCLQNGVANERMALRLFPNVHGVMVLLPAVHLEPGSVVVNSSGITGILDVGRAPDGVDEVDARVAADLSERDVLVAARAGRPRLEAGQAPPEPRERHRGGVRRPAQRCGPCAGDTGPSRGRGVLRRRGLAMDRRCRVRGPPPGVMAPWRPADGARRAGSSTWQSLLRHTGSTEVDYLNGEIVLLGRLHGVPTPANALLQTTIRRMAIEGSEPGAFSAQRAPGPARGQPA